MSVDERGTELTARRSETGMMPPEAAAQIARMSQQMDAMQRTMLALMGEVRRVSDALALMRVSRVQERAIGEAIRARARELARLEGMGEAAERRIAGAIRTTLREVTGARAVGDIEARKYEQVMGLISGWRMAGAMRKIKKEMDKR